MKKITLYSKVPCGYCVMAKNLLTARHLEFEEVDLTENDELRDKISKPHHWRTLPMIFIGDEFIGGFRELSELDKQGLLQDKVSSKRGN